MKREFGSIRETRNGFLDGVLYFLTFLYVLALLAFFACIILQIGVTHTYFDPPSPIGQLVSERYTTLRWWSLALLALHIFVPAFVIMTWGERWLKRSGSLILWIVLLGFLVAVFVLIVIALGMEKSHCNGQNQKGNLCNDLLWCCIPDIYNNPQNGCPPGPCTASNPPIVLPTTLDDLQEDTYFVWLFWSHVGLTIASLLMLLIAIIVGFYEEEYTPLSNVRRVKRIGLPQELREGEEEEEEEDHDNDNDDVEYIDSRILDSSKDYGEVFTNNRTKGRRTAGTRRRKPKVIKGMYRQQRRTIEDESQELEKVGKGGGGSHLTVPVTAVTFEKK